MKLTFYKTAQKNGLRDIFTTGDSQTEGPIFLSNNFDHEHCSVTIVTAMTPLAFLGTVIRTVRMVARVLAAVNNGLSFDITEAL